MACARFTMAAAVMAQSVQAINPDGFPNNLTGAIRGWRSWNAVMADVTQEFISRQVRASATRCTWVFTHVDSAFV